MNAEVIIATRKPVDAAITPAQDFVQGAILQWKSSARRPIEQKAGTHTVAFVCTFVVARREVEASDDGASVLGSEEFLCH